MKIVKTGDISRIFSDDLKTFDKLPVGNYKIHFAPMTGFYLKDADSFRLNEKSYGKQPLKIDKIIKLYKNIDRSAGIILSGKKGMGKSMFARSLSSKFDEMYSMPTIIVTEAYPGIVDFIESIKQECLVLFDEFEKVFDNSDDTESQDKLLSLFDGISQTKRLYVVTVNEIRRVNQYMINRPGRFHYHFQFNYPSSEEVELYLNDKLKPEYHNQIKLVQRFSNRFDLNYDSLRAIAFELNLGHGFLETMEDLNISSSESDSNTYEVAIYHSNGSIINTEINIDLMSSECSFGYYTPSSEYVAIEFSPLDIEIYSKETFAADGEHFEVTCNDGSEFFTDGVKVDKIVFTKKNFGRFQYGKEFEHLLI